MNTIKAKVEKGVALNEWDDKMQEATQRQKLNEDMDNIVLSSTSAGNFGERLLLGESSPGAWRRALTCLWPV